MGILFMHNCVLCGEAIPVEDGSKAMICAACAREVRGQYRLSLIHICALYFERY